MGERRGGRDLEEALIWRGSPGYEHVWASMLWNELKPQRFPDVIVQASSEHDVLEAVRLARSRGLRVVVRSGGHSWCGSPLRDGGKIDLSRLRGQTIDPVSATATVQPGVTGRARTAQGLKATLRRSMSAGAHDVPKIHVLTADLLG